MFKLFIKASHPKWATKPDAHSSKNYLWCISYDFWV